MEFNGVITALITPFKNGNIDFDALDKLLNFQIKNGIGAVVIAGSTGEAHSLSEEEYFELIKTAAKFSSQNFKIIANLNSNITHKAIDTINRLNDLPIDGIMGVVPYYVKPTQEGIYEHFKSIHEASSKPIIIYSVPSRVGVDFTEETLLKLSQLPKIKAFKDATPKFDRVISLSTKVTFTMLSGDDITAVAYNACGGEGIISVASNIIPQECRQIQELCKNNNFIEARTMHARLAEFYNALFIESNPIAVKYAASLIGLCTDELRLPLTPALENTRTIVRKSLEALKIL